MDSKDSSSNKIKKIKKEKKVFLSILEVLNGECKTVRWNGKIYYASHKMKHILQISERNTENEHTNL